MDLNELFKLIGRAASGSSNGRQSLPEWIVEKLTGVVSTRPRQQKSDDPESLKERFARGEDISDDELATAPIVSVPRELVGRRSQLLVKSMTKRVLGASPSPRSNEENPIPSGQASKTESSAGNSAGGTESAAGNSAIRREPAADGKESVVDQWKQASHFPVDRSIENTLATVNEASLQKGQAKSTRRPKARQPQDGPPPASNDSQGEGNQYPSFYHQRDSAGNTMADLLQQRGKGRGSKSVQQAIKQWAKEFDASQKGPSQRSQSSDHFRSTTTPSPQKQPSPASSSPRHNPHRASIVYRWRELQKSGAKGIASPANENLRSIVRAQDGSSQPSTTIPKQSQLSTPAAIPRAQRAPDFPVQKVSEEQVNPNSGDGEPSPGQNSIDALQLGLDAYGVFGDAVLPGSGVVADGANAAISLGRAFTDPERRGEHLKNAAISTVSMVPFVGDTAKLLKAKSAAKTAGRTGKMIRGADDAGSMLNSPAAIQARRKKRQEYRNRAKNVIGDDISSGPAGGGRNGGGDPPVVSGGSGGGDESPRKQRKEGEGIRELDKWKNRLSGTGRKLFKFTGFLGKATAAGASFVQGLSLVNTGVLALNRDLAKHNGGIASAYAKADAKDIRRDIEKGEQLEQPLRNLSREQSELKDSISSISVPMQAIGIQIVSAITASTNTIAKGTGAVQVASGALGGLAALLGANAEGGEGTAYQQLFQDLSDGKFDGKRPTFSGDSKQILSDKDHQEVFGR